MDMRLNGLHGVERDRERARLWRLANPERMKLLNRRHYEKDKPARNEQAKAWRKANPEKAKAVSRASAQRWRKRNPNHKREYEAKNRLRINAKALEWRRRNIEKARLASRKWNRTKGEAYRKENKDALLKYVRLWRSENKHKYLAGSAKRRARVKGAAGSGYTRSEHIAGRWEMFGCKCWVCGGKATATDHVKPLAKGGAHWPSNLRPICKPCNTRKRDMWPFAVYSNLKTA